MLTCTCVYLKCVLHLVAPLGDELLSLTLYAINVNCNLTLTDVGVGFHMYHVNGNIRLANLMSHNKGAGLIIFAAGCYVSCYGALNP